MLLVALLLLTAGLTFSVDLYLTPKYMVWEEYEGGKRLLREEGYVFGGGVRQRWTYFTVGGDAYWGNLDYDGQTQGGTPLTTQSDYAGWSVYLGPALELGDETFARLEVLYNANSWVRNINSTSSAEGYSEAWFYQAVSFGGELGRYLYDYREVYLIGYYNYLFDDARMQASVKGIPELRPKKGLSYSAGIGLRVDYVSFEVMYSYLEFKRSDPKPFQSGYVLQPRSVRRLWEARLYILF